jgi:hypothetical protein
VTKARVADWLRARDPAPPRALAERLEQMLAAFPDAGVTEAATVSALMATLGVATLGALASRDARSVDVALDLLAADAFVTFAFEAAVEEGVEVGPLADRILGQVGA